MNGSRIIFTLDIPGQETICEDWITHQEAERLFAEAVEQHYLTPNAFMEVRVDGVQTKIHFNEVANGHIVTHTRPI